MPQRLATGGGPIADPWRPAAGPAYDCDPLAPEEFDDAVIAYNLDGLTVRRVRFGRMRFTRANRVDAVMIGRYLSGSLHGCIGDAELHKAPGQISLEDLSVPCEGMTEDSEVLSVVVPRDRLPCAERLGARLPVYSLALNGAGGSLLGTAMQTLWDNLRAGRDNDPAVAAGGFLGLVNGLIEHGVAAPSDPEPGALMERYLREHLGDPTLGPERLQQAFNYSRSAIYRLFEHHGGVAAFIRSERLRRCHAELLRSNTPGAVSAVAARYGFYDASHFSRVFRRRYGIAPSQLASAGTLASWLED